MDLADPTDRQIGVEYFETLVRYLSIIEQKSVAEPRLLGGLSAEVSSGPMLMVDGQIYLDTGKQISAEFKSTTVKSVWVSLSWGQSRRAVPDLKTNTKTVRKGPSPVHARQPGGAQGFCHVTMAEDLVFSELIAPIRRRRTH